MVRVLASAILESRDHAAPVLSRKEILKDELGS